MVPTEQSRVEPGRECDPESGGRRAGARHEDSAAPEHAGRVSRPAGGLALMVSILPAAQGAFDANRAAPQLESELVFPLEHWHNHASMIVEAPNGDLLVVLVPRLRRAHRGRRRHSRRAAEKGREGVERAVPARGHARLSGHQRDDVHRSAAAAVAAVADDSRERVAHGADEVPDLVGLPARGSAAMGRRATCCT